MFLLNNIKVHQDIQRTIGDVQYPAGWFSHDAEARAKVGMIEVPDPVRPDDNLFASVENPDGSYTSTPRTAADIAARQVAANTEKAKSVRATRGILIAATDWSQCADIDQATKDKWAPYRKALRDVPQQAGFPFSVVSP
jgi:hypothetical protein